MSGKPKQVQTKTKKFKIIKKENPINPIPKKILDEFKYEIYSLTKNTTLTKPGSVKHLLFGEETSRQSISIRCGKPIGESFPKKLINSTQHLKLEICGCLKLNNSENKKDFDLIFKEEQKKKCLL